MNAKLGFPSIKNNKLIQEAGLLNTWNMYTAIGAADIDVAFE